MTGGNHLRAVGPGERAEPRRSWTLEWEQRPVPMNKYRTLHYRERANYDREWRRIFGTLAQVARVPHLAAVNITVVQTCAHHSLPDVGAAYPTAKAAIDGLVDAGVLDDDTPEIVRFIGFAAPERSDKDRLVLVLEEGEPPT